MRYKITIEGTNFSNIDEFYNEMEKLKMEKNRQGETLFDVIVNEILDKNDWYDHTLVCDDNTF